MMLRPARPDDRDGIYEVEIDSFSVPWMKESISHELARTDLTLYYVLTDDDENIMGYAGLWVVLDEGQITNIALRREARGKGYGELLLRRLMESAWEKGCTDIFLEVRFSNFPALHLYRKLGYTVLSVRKGYYDEPVEDAYVMGCRKENYHWVTDEGLEGRD